MGLNLNLCLYNTNKQCNRPNDPLSLASQRYENKNVRPKAKPKSYAGQKRLGDIAKYCIAELS